MSFLSNQAIIKAVTFQPNWLKEPYSWVGHIPFAAWLVRSVKPRVYVELGTHTGNSYFSVCQASKEYQTGTKCFAVDTWQGDAHAKKYGEEVFEMVQQHNFENYADFSNLLRMTFDKALDQFEDGSVDLLHIDGLHTYEAVRHDFETWLPKLAPGGIVMFHDTNVFKEDFGVWKYWGELKEQYSDHIEFKYSHGLGLIQIPFQAQEQPANFSLDMLTTGVVEYFVSLGNKWELIEKNSALDHANEKHLAQVRELWSERDQLSEKLNRIQGNKVIKLFQKLRIINSL